MAEKEPIIVIKKITVQAAGHHGGSWKVAFADFMTAMMAFFLVMWLISQSEEVKQNVSDYFSTPSIIEYNFSNFGAELTLEKLFLDLMNEPLKVFETFVTPIDRTPNIMAMGTKKIVLHHMADQLGDLAEGVEVFQDEISFEIPADVMFAKGTPSPSDNFVGVMEKVSAITGGLEDSNIYVDSEAYFSSDTGVSLSEARNLAQARLDLILRKVEVKLEHETVSVYGKPKPTEYVAAATGGVEPKAKVKFRIKQKEFKKDGSKNRKIEDLFGKKDASMNVYDNFVKQISKSKKTKRKNPKDWRNR